MSFLGGGEGFVSLIKFQGIMDLLESRFLNALKAGHKSSTTGCAIRRRCHLRSFLSLPAASKSPKQQRYRSNVLLPARLAIHFLLTQLAWVTCARRSPRWKISCGVSRFPEKRRFGLHCEGVERASCCRSSKSS